MGTGWRHSRHLVSALLFPGVPARRARDRRCAVALGRRLRDDRAGHRRPLALTLARACDVPVGRRVHQNVPASVHNDTPAARSVSRLSAPWARGNRHRVMSPSNAMS
jgi:hypothetical protein